MITRNPNKTIIDYGRTGISLALNPEIADWTVIEPDNAAPLPDFKKAFHRAADKPIGSKPLADLISPSDKVVIVTSDNTRPVPNKILIPEIIEACHSDYANFTILIGSGSHRPHAGAEVEQMLGRDIMRQCRVICHDASDDGVLKYLGKTKSGIPVSMNKKYLDADKKIVIGFIEPHFFAGFSGGAKGICPALCGIDTIKAFHSYEIISDPLSNYGHFEDNPQQQAARDAAALAPPDFLINVTLNSAREITGIYAGDYLEAHRAGAKEVAAISTSLLDKKFPIVVTSNSGFPLDQNLYQTVKGIWAAFQVAEEGGSIVVVSECSQGIPSGSNFEKILSSHISPQLLLNMLERDDFKMIDRWQAQKLAEMLLRVEIHLFSSLSTEDTARCQLIKMDNLDFGLRRLAVRYGPKPFIAVLPKGPLTIPLVKQVPDQERLK